MPDTLPREAAPSEGLGNLEAIAGLADDLTSMTLARAQQDFEKLVRDRFGPDVDIDDVRKAMEAMQDLSNF